MIKARAPVTEKKLREWRVGVTNAVTYAEPVTDGVTHCPTCGRRLAKRQTPAEKQRAYRARLKTTHHA